jgi:hypothetical protein
MTSAGDVVFATCHGVYGPAANAPASEASMAISVVLADWTGRQLDRSSTLLRHYGLRTIYGQPDPSDVVRRPSTRADGHRLRTTRLRYRHGVRRLLDRAKPRRQRQHHQNRDGGSTLPSVVLPHPALSTSLLCSPHQVARDDYPHAIGRLLDTGNVIISAASPYGDHVRRQPRRTP